MSAKRKLRRQHAKEILHEPPVLIVRPYNPEGLTSEETHQFEAFNFGNRIADMAPRKSKLPEIARNAYIKEFLDEKGKWRQKTHIFFLDDDSPPLLEDTIVRLLRHNKPVVCIPTPILRYDYDLQHLSVYWNTVGLVEGHTEENPKFEVYSGLEIPRRLFKCYRTGGTGILIRREVFKKLQPPYQQSTFNSDWTNIEKSEDIDFCDKIRRAGFDIWADGTLVCRHFHRIDILDIVALIEQIQASKPYENDPMLKDIIQNRLKRLV